MSLPPGTRPSDAREQAEPSAARWFVRIFLTLRGRLILLVCFATVPAILFIFSAASRERQAALDRIETEARHLGTLASREHAHQLNGAAALLERMADPGVCDASPDRLDACPPYLAELLSGFPQFANLGFADPRGEVLCSGAPIPRPAYLTNNTAFVEALRSPSVEVGTYVIGFVERPVLHLARALRLPGGEPCAVGFVAVELGWLDEMARQANLPADYSLLIADRTGRVLARSGAGLRDGDPGRPNPDLVAALGRPRGAVIEIGTPAVSQYVVATPMEGVPGVFVVSGLPFERVQQAADVAFYRTLIGLVLVTIFAVAAALLAAEFAVLRVLRSLTRAVRRFGAGDLAARAPLPGSHGELRELAVSFGAMADALAARQREADEARDRLRALSHRVQTARDAEAGRIARELHDELGQILTGLKMEMTRACRVCPGNALVTGDVGGMGNVTLHIDAAIDFVRRISSELRPPVLDRLGLSSAVEWLVQEVQARESLSIALHLSDLGEPIDPLVATTIFRVVQESLTNVVRHARATEVTIDLTAHESTLVLSIHDNGIGIDSSAMEGPHALGIFGMRERVQLLAGSFHLHGVPGGGTTLEVEIPRDLPPALAAGGEPRS